MSHGIVIDLLTILVMSVAVYYAVRLNRSLMKARDGRAELTQLIASLTDAQGRAESAIRTMKVTAAEYELSLQKQIAVSRGLIEELSLINDTSNTIANRLERLVPQARGSVESGATALSYTTRPASDPLERSRQSPPPPLRAERPIISGDARPISRTEAKPARPVAQRPTQPPTAQPQSAVQAPVPAGQPAPASSSVPDTASNIRPLASAARSAQEPTGDPDKPRSRAERELFAAIETLRKGRPT